MGWLKRLIRKKQCQEAVDFTLIADGHLTLEAIVAFFLERYVSIARQEIILTVTNHQTKCETCAAQIEKVRGIIEGMFSEDFSALVFDVRSRLNSS